MKRSSAAPVVLWYVHVPPRHFPPVPVVTRQVSCASNVVPRMPTTSASQGEKGCAAVFYRPEYATAVLGMVMGAPGRVCCVTVSAKNCFFRRARRTAVAACGVMAACAWCGYRCNVG